MYYLLLELLVYDINDQFRKLHSVCDWIPKSTRHTRHSVYMTKTCCSKMASTGVYAQTVVLLRGTGRLLVHGALRLAMAGQHSLH